MLFVLELDIILITMSAKHATESSGRSKGKAVFLAIVLGGIGAHKF